MTIIVTIETIVGSLFDVYREVVPGTFFHSDQLTNERRTHPNEQERTQLQSRYFYTADGIIYSLQKGVPTLSITREEDNLVLRHLNDEVNNPYSQLITRKNYYPDSTETQQAISAAQTVTIDLTKLRFFQRSWDVCCLAVPTTMYDELNAEERKLAERVYGQGKDFIANMNMLNENNVKWAAIYVLNPDYVREIAQSGPIARACWLNNIYNNAGFIAYDNCVNALNHLRGNRFSE